MSIIRDSYDPRSVMLTVTQKGVLAVVYNSPTPEMAFEVINGTPAMITARNLLERLGFIEVAGNKVVLTPEGSQAIISNGIADESGQLTDAGTALIDEINNDKKDYNIVETFTLLNSLMRG